VLDQIETGTTVPLLQDSSQASRAPRLQKEDGRIDWNKTPWQIDCQVRALQPWPMAYTTLATRSTEDNPRELSFRLIVLEVTPAPTLHADPQLLPGTVVVADRKRLVIQTGQGAIEILRLRPEGRRAMSAAEFLAGNPVTSGDRLDSAL
jgi:methionyl-tRNA formyltransferase